MRRVGLPRGNTTYSLLFEQVQAARWGGYKVHEFFDLDTEAQGFVIAAYRTHTLIEACEADHQQREVKRKSKQKHGAV